MRIVHKWIETGLTQSESSDPASMCIQCGRALETLIL